MIQNLRAMLEFILQPEDMTPMSNVRDFGAAGDGMTDDWEAIRHALADGDGCLEFSPGTYRLSRTLEIPLDKHGPTSITGSAATKIVMAGSGPAFRFIGTHAGTGSPNTVKPEVWTRQRLPMVQNLEIEGAHEEADGLELTGTMQSVISGVLIRHCRHGIHLHTRNRNVLIIGCHIYHNTGVGIYLKDLNLHQINITGSHVSYNRQGGIRIEGSEIRNLQITGNDIEYNNFRVFGQGPEPTAEIYIDTTAPKTSVEEVTIASNTIQATDSAGGANIRILEKPGEDRPPGLFSITGNIIGSQENNVHLTGCYGVVLSGNTIYSCKNRNLLLEDCRQITMTGNYFRRHTPEYQTGVRIVNSTDCTFQGSIIHDETEVGQQSGASLLELSGCRRINISGSQFLDGVPYGIEVENSDHIQITSSTVMDTRKAPTAKGTIRFRGTGTGNRIALCTLESGNGQRGTQLATESGVTFTE